MTGLYRQTDPWTSVEAAREITVSGRRQSIQELCLEYIQHHPGETAGEIGDGTGLGHLKVWRRLSDLKNQGRIVMGEARVWHGTRQSTWQLACEVTPEQAVMSL